MSLAGAAIALVALPAGAVAGPWEGAAGLLSTLAWIAGGWVVASLLSVTLVLLWFRSRARRNLGLTAEGRREAWLAEVQDRSPAGQPVRR